MYSAHGTYPERTSPVSGDHRARVPTTAGSNASNFAATACPTPKPNATASTAANSTPHRRPNPRYPAGRTTRCERASPKKAAVVLAWVAYHNIQQAVRVDMEFARRFNGNPPVVTDNVVTLVLDLDGFSR